MVNKCTCCVAAREANTTTETDNCNRLFAYCIFFFNAHYVSCLKHSVLASIFFNDSVSHRVQSAKSEPAGFLTILRHKYHGRTDLSLSAVSEKKTVDIMDSDK